MIEKNQFYYSEDMPSKSEQKKMWEEIRYELFMKNTVSRRSSIELRSFVYGIAFTVLIFVVTMTAIKLVPGIMFDFKGSDTEINRAYSKAANELEKSLPDFISSFDKSERTRLLLNARLEELKEINDAIKEYQQILNQSDYTKIKQERMRELYQLKIDAIYNIIQLKGDLWL